VEEGISYLLLYTLFFFMHEAKRDTMSEHGTLFRIRTERLRFRPMVPFDEDNNEVVFGTGFLLKHEDKHYILTNHHVISNARRVTATTHGVEDGLPRQLKVVGMQPHLDVAILEMVEGIDKKMVQNEMKCFKGDEGRSSDIKAASRVIVLGFANADRHLHTTSGTVSGRTNWPLNRIQTDAVVNPGNSGGPVVDENGSFVGIVTSGMDEMQPTNHFVGYDEIIVCLRRINERVREESAHGPCSDLGLHINAVLVAVDPSALFQGPRSSISGALVTDALSLPSPHENLVKGDVILAVNVGGTFRELDSHMMIHVPEVWSHRLDFRVWLDRIAGTDRVLSWEMQVLRQGKTETVVVSVGPNMLKSRYIKPDCEPVSYIIFHGLVIQIFNRAHALYLMDSDTDDAFKDPEVNINSYPVITDALPECPFTFQDSIHLTGKRIRHVMSKTQDSRVKFEEPSSKEGSIKDLHTMIAIMRSVPADSDVVLVLENGERVGATTQQIKEYTESNSVAGDKLSRRENMVLHRVLLPYWKEATYDVYPSEPIDPRRPEVPAQVKPALQIEETLKPVTITKGHRKEKGSHQRNVMIVGISLFVATCFRLMS
jgi:S1-C subfamily serine protease